MKILDKTTFIQEINNLHSVSSIQGKLYRSIRVEGQSVRFIREGKTTPESINLNELFDLYQAKDNPNTSDAKPFISGRVQSPAIAIISALRNIKSVAQAPTQTPQYERVSEAKETESERIPTSSQSNDKDETRFFRAFSVLVGEEYLLSKSINKPINSDHAYLSDDFQKFEFTPDLIENFTSVLTELNSNFNFSGKSLATYIDGMLVNHPQLGTRIIEFDEEQHFTPSLYTVLSKQTQLIDLPFIAYYYATLNILDYLNNEVLKKNRIKHQFEHYPTNHPTFLAVLKDHKESGYIKPKPNGFDYLGGRVAQRAYYDSLRNAAHLSPKNPNFKPILRFPKKYFEDKSGNSFSRISSEQIIRHIRDYLKEIYNVEI
jgi:hypothetical protein